MKIGTKKFDSALRISQLEREARSFKRANKNRFGDMRFVSCVDDLLPDEGPGKYLPRNLYPDSEKLFHFTEIWRRDVIHGLMNELENSMMTFLKSPLALLRK